MSHAKMEPEASEYLLVLMTTGTIEEAKTIARALVDGRLAACVNILPRITSVFRWQGAINEESEAVLILKTRRHLVDEATKRIKELHSYDCPCVVSLAITGGNGDYLDWIVKETK